MTWLGRCKDDELKLLLCLAIFGLARKQQPLRYVSQEDTERQRGTSISTSDKGKKDIVQR